MNAKDAKILTSNCKKGNVSQILRRINNAASMGVSKIYNINLHSAQRVRLLALGYKIELSSDVMEDYEIS